MSKSIHRHALAPSLVCVCPSFYSEILMSWTSITALQGYWTKDITCLYSSNCDLYEDVLDRLYTSVYIVCKWKSKFITSHLGDLDVSLCCIDLLS
ncbi:hypothetical protein CY34DRAFT_400900 [Suillus luteus UH-Slu-Lm8-n1]|uniref:Uncharacterized protein n=1 Tax=Suillus luteus UH-Slu-Lm8-n1 TaxID=930992 RepID=A0A0D0A8S5_9AGAM|nr:hypothetical protein CY34DRAFT_400900 [Suillus luteus UH-Slu-Lm8-n1]